MDKTNNKYKEEMLNRTGNVSSEDPLVGFLYILMRDHILPGDLEKIMLEHVTPSYGCEASYTNGFLARYAKDIAERLNYED